MTNGRVVQIVTVEIFGGQYPVRSNLDATYVKRIAEYVDRKMYAAADQTRGGDSVRIAVLAALNIADEHFRLLEARASGSNARRLTMDLEELIDTALTGPAPAAESSDEAEAPATGESDEAEALAADESDEAETPA